MSLTQGGVGEEELVCSGGTLRGRWELGVWGQMEEWEDRRRVGQLGRGPL